MTYPAHDFRRAYASERARKDVTSNAFNVTEPFLPPIEDYIALLDGIWTRNQMTNQGPLVKELERVLKEYHATDRDVHCIANGALGLQIATRALGIRGEIVTTPFSYIATTACPLWDGCSVKFADIEREYLTLDPAAVDAAITPRTEAILATHVFGNPCDVEGLARVARRHRVALIYDAAHGFGVKFNGKSILDFGDASMVSMHATKVFHSIEGGFVVARDPEIAAKVEWMRRFGHNGPGRFFGVGLNAKLSEFHAAMGLAVFKHIGLIMNRRAAAVATYDDCLASFAGLAPAFKLRPGTQWNYAYYPVLFQSEVALLGIAETLANAGIHTRRYFYPLTDVVTQVHADCAVARDIAARILCLPLSASPDLDPEYISKAIIDKVSAL